jgi:hypothetical protein|tara:strand:+ start:371 stop:658 length:288 start_codon:yes stop_codon:yes gene_type:complete
MFKVFVYSLFLTFISLIVFNQVISHEIKNQTRELNKINSSIRYQENKEILLKTDWVVRTSPARLKDLAEKHFTKLRLEAAKGENIKFIKLEEEKN